MSTFFQEELQRQVDERGEIVRWMLLIGVAVSALMEVIDMSITNVALPHIQGNLNATSSEAAWVVTAYSIANVITMPLATMLGIMFGKKGYFVFSIDRFHFRLDRLRNGIPLCSFSNRQNCAGTVWRRSACQSTGLPF